MPRVESRSREHDGFLGPEATGWQMNIDEWDTEIRDDAHLYVDLYYK